MAKNGIEGTAAMGTDTPLAALSGNREPLFNYFKQLFAQVTNPPIVPSVRRLLLLRRCISDLPETS